VYREELYLLDKGRSSVYVVSPSDGMLLRNLGPAAEWRARVSSHLRVMN
jgi:hypothetical protein